MNLQTHIPFSKNTSDPIDYNSRIILLGSCFSDNIGQFISTIWVWEWGKEAFTTISEIFGGLLIIVLGLVLYKHIIMALSAPFMSPVSEKIETYLLGEDSKLQHRNTSFQARLWRGIKINVRNFMALT